MLSTFVLEANISLVNDIIRSYELNNNLQFSVAKTENRFSDTTADGGKS